MLWVHVHKQNHLVTEEENPLSTGQVTAVTGLIPDPIWGFSMNADTVTLPKDKRLPCNFLSPSNIYPQPLLQCRIDLSSDLSWLWSAPVILTLPAVLEETQTFFQRLNSWPIMVSGSDMGCAIWQIIQACLFFFLQAFLSDSISCFLFCAHSSWANAVSPCVSMDCFEVVCEKWSEKGNLLEGLNPLQSSYTLTGKWSDTRKSLKRSEYCCYRGRQLSFPWYLSYSSLVVQPDVACLCLFSGLGLKHVCVPSKMGMGQLGSNFIAELGTLKWLQGVFVGHLSSPHTVLGFFVLIVWLPCFSPEHWPSKKAEEGFLFCSILNQNLYFLLLLLGLHWKPFSKMLLEQWPFICPSRKNPNKCAPSACFRTALTFLTKLWQQIYYIK